MEVERSLLREQYKANFDSEAFLELYTVVDDGEAFFIKKLYQYFSTGDIKGSRALDFGCGPIVHRLGPASLIFDTLVFSDFGDTNKEFVQNWLNRKSPHPKFEHFFRFMASQERFINTDAGAISIENRIKSKTSKITHCDIFNPLPLGPTEPLFDVILSGGCLESACLNYEEFLIGINNISNLLKPGGYLILLTYLESKSYKVAEFKYPTFDIKTYHLREGLEKSGFQVIDVDDIYPKIRPRPDLAPSTGVAIALAKKL